MNPIQSTTTPYGLPWGNMPKNARKSARELDNAAMNSQTMFLWQMRLYELAMSVFEWENLPEGINEEMLAVSGKIADIDRQMQDMYLRIRAAETEKDE